MGVRIVLADREPIALALKRFQKLLDRHGITSELRHRGRSVQTGAGHFVKPTQKRRAKRFQKKFKARMATLVAKLCGKPAATSKSKAVHEFWKETGKP